MVDFLSAEDNKPFKLKFALQFFVQEKILDFLIAAALTNKPRGFLCLMVLLITHLLIQVKNG